LDGRRGLVPSNYITKLVGEDLVEFHQSMVLTGSGSNEVADEGWSTSIPQVFLCSFSTRKKQGNHQNLIFGVFVREGKESWV
jgi:hypothetical protein